MHSINPTGYRIRIKFDKEPLAVEQNNHFNKIVNVSVVLKIGQETLLTISDLKIACLMQVL